MGFGQFLAKEWIHVVSEESGTWDPTVYATKAVCAEQHAKQYAREEYNNMLARAPEHAQSMGKACSGAQGCIMQTRLSQLALRTCIVWKSSSWNGVKLEVCPDPGFGYVSGEWIGLDGNVGGIVSLSAHHFSITVHRKQNIKTYHTATLHLKLMTVQSPRVASPTAAHTQQNSQEIVSF